MCTTLQLTLSAVYESDTVLADGSVVPTPANASLPVREYNIHHLYHLSNAILCAYTVCFFMADDLVTGAQTANTAYIPVFLPDGSSFVSTGIVNVSIQVGIEICSMPVSGLCYSSPDRTAQSLTIPSTDIPSNSI